MAQYNSAVITNKGRALLAKLVAGEDPLTFTKASSGNGNHPEGEDLETKTALTSAQQDFNISEFTRSGATLSLKFTITNNPGVPLQTGYNITEIGIFANDPDEGEILYSIITAKTGKEDFLPAYDGETPISIGMTYITTLSSGLTVTLEFSPDNYITYSELIYELESRSGVPNGFATLDSGGRIPYSQLPETAIEYKGLWNAATNTPHLENGVGTHGDMYIVSVAGTFSGEAYLVNDRIIYDGPSEQWKRLPGGNVTSVAGRTGAVTLTAADIGAGTLAGRVQANATQVAALGNKQVRNIYAGTTDMTDGVSTLTAGDIYIYYKEP